MLAHYPFEGVFQIVTHCACLLQGIDLLSSMPLRVKGSKVLLHERFKLSPSERQPKTFLTLSSINEKLCHQENQDGLMTHVKNSYIVACDRWSRSKKIPTFSSIEPPHCLRTGFLIESWEVFLYLWGRETSIPFEDEWALALDNCTRRRFDMLMSAGREELDRTQLLSRSNHTGKTRFAKFARS